MSARLATHACLRERSSFSANVAYLGGGGGGLCQRLDVSAFRLECPLSWVIRIPEGFRKETIKGSTRNMLASAGPKAL